MTRYFRHTEWLAVREQIAVAVCTYKRPVMLRACLASLQDAGAAVLVINNDPHTPDLGELPGNPTVVHEKARGIANARNRALREAQARGYRYLAFIDDDETAGADWLFNLMIEMRQHRCAAATGPVHYAYPADAPAYKRRTGYGTARHEEGSLRPCCATNNLLLDLRQVAIMRLAFDDRCNISGGEDTLFSMQLVARGGEIRWTNMAIVTETVPAERLTLKAHLKRSYHKGQHTVQTAELNGRLRPGALAVKAVRRAFCGALALMPAPLAMAFGIHTGNKLIYSGCRKVAEGLGVLAGLCGRRSTYYGVTTGF